ncbi:MAG: peptide deformylase [Rhodospirillaceae bacterium]|nr:peptide deformylase [Rhodospirillaceae bacterium]
MTLLKIARMGHPVLRRPALPVDSPTDPDIARLVRDMADTMLDAHGVGLAAPQVYRDLRVIVFRVPQDRAEDGEPEAPRGLTALINPVITPVGDDLALGLEGCLSIPGLRGLVPRYRRIVYQGVTPDGTRVERAAEGFHARVVQHEVDHLDGILFFDRVSDLADIAFDDEAHHLVTRYQPASEG